MTVSAPWHESGTFWTIFVGAVVAIGVGIFSAYSNYRTVNPKRLFSYCLRKNTSLLNASHRASDALGVTHGTTQLNRPRVVEIEVKNEGRMAVTAQDFHGGESVEFDVGAPIIALLEKGTVPSHHRVPNVSFTGSVLKIEPSLLSSKQSASFTLLVDGPRADMECRSPLINIPVKERKPEDPPTPAQVRYAKRSLRVASAIMVSCVLLLGYSFYMAKQVDSVLDDSGRIQKDTQKMLDEARRVKGEAERLRREAGELVQESSGDRR